MPSIEAIDRIKNIVNSLGDEEAILQQKGVAIEDVLPPAEEVDEDLQDLLGSGPDELNDMTTMDSLLSTLEEDTSEDETLPLDDLDLGDLNLEEEPEDDLSLIDEPLSDELPENDLVLPEDFDLDEVPDGDDGLEELDSLPLAEEPEEDDFEDLEELGDLGELDDLEDLSLEDDEDLAKLEDLDVSDLSLEPEEEAPAADDLELPDAGLAMESLADSLDEETSFDDMDAGGEEIVLDEDFGLNEIDDDFLDDLNESDENQFSLDDLGAEYNFTEDESDLSLELGLDLDELEKT